MRPTHRRARTTMNKTQTTDSRRIGYFEGQLLTAHDLQDDVAYEARMRGLHVRALHNTWGVALGFSVARKAGNVVEISPGVAYDCHGREIVSSRTLNIGRPPRPSHSRADAWLYDLLIRYREPETRGNAGVNCPGGLSPGEEQPLWRWRFAGDADQAENGGAAPEEMRLGEEVPLARFRITAQGELDPPDFSVRYSAQGLVRPHIASGSVETALTFNEEQAAYTIAVDTAAAGFSSVPFYFAAIYVPAVLAFPTTSRFTFAGPFLTVRAPARTRFLLDVRLGLATGFDDVGLTAGAVVRRAASAVATAVATAAVPPATVTWLGIEPVGGCAPPLQLTPLLFYLPPIFQLVAMSTAPGVATTATLGTTAAGRLFT